MEDEFPFVDINAPVPRNTLATDVGTSAGQASLSRRHAIAKPRRSRSRLSSRVSAREGSRQLVATADLSGDSSTAVNNAHMKGDDVPAVDDTPIYIVPSDTHIALMALRAEWPGDTIAELSRLPPIVLVSQLYALVADRDAVDHEVDAMRSANVIRYFKLPASDEDHHAVVLTEDLRNSVTRNAKLSEPTLEVFFDRLLPECTYLEVSEEDIGRYFKNASGTATELIHAGLLTLKDEHSFWFSVPYAGYFTQMRRKGNKELTGILQRAPFREMLLSKLELRRLRSSCFPAIFHIRDVIGSCGAETVSTTLGMLVRIRNETDNGWLI